MASEEDEDLEDFASLFMKKLSLMPKKQIEKIFSENKENFLELAKDLKMMKEYENTDGLYYDAGVDFSLPLNLLKTYESYVESDKKNIKVTKTFFNTCVKFFENNKNIRIQESENIAIFLPLFNDFIALLDKQPFIFFRDQHMRSNLNLLGVLNINLNLSVHFCFALMQHGTFDLVAQKYLQMRGGNPQNVPSKCINFFDSLIKIFIHICFLQRSTKKILEQNTFCQEILQNFGHEKSFQKFLSECKDVRKSKRKVLRQEEDANPIYSLICKIFCGNCKKIQTPGQIRFKKCARCEMIFYCSRECQVDHWKPCHKKKCKKKTNLQN